MGEIAQVKGLGWRGDGLEVMWVNIAKEESKSTHVRGKAEERQETFQGCEGRVLEK